MASRSLRSAVCAVLLAFSAASAGQTHLEVAYSEVNPDWKPYSNGAGVRVLGSLALPHSFLIFGSYNTATLKTSGPELSRHQEAWGWRIAGAGWGYSLTNNLRLKGGASYQGVDLHGGYESGWAIHTGFQFMPLKWLFLDLDIAYLDLIVEDISLEATLGVHLVDQVALTFRIHDHSDWDFTAYEAGLRLLF